MDKVVQGIAGDYVGNYTGPYWSNGKVQQSVEWGDMDPKSQLDFLSRQHDSAYARFKDEAHREAADMIYNQEAKKLVGAFPQLAGDLVLYGNYAKRALSRTAENAGTGMKLFGLPGLLGGLIYTAAGNVIQENKMINGTYLRDEKRDVLNYFDTDPLKDKFSHLGPSSTQSRNEGGRALPSTDNKVHPLIEKQARRFEKHAALKEAAEKSKQKQENIDVPVWNMLGWQGWHAKRMRKKKKINKIKIKPISY